jgi:hypothetical protein
LAYRGGHRWNYLLGMGEVMNEQCKFKVGKYHCGSYAFNLYKEQIDQGDRCDHHYWQERAETARADEREACAKACEHQPHWTACAAAIKARGTT